MKKTDPVDVLAIQHACAPTRMVRGAGIPP